MYFVLFACSLRKLGELYLRASNNEHQRKRRGISIGLSAFIVSSLINFNVLNDSTLLRNWLLIDSPQFVSKNETRVREALLLSNLTDEHAVIAVTWAGALPYFLNRKAVDSPGKNGQGSRPGKSENIIMAGQVNSVRFPSGALEMGLLALIRIISARRDSSNMVEFR